MDLLRSILFFYGVVDSFSSFSLHHSSICIHSTQCSSMVSFFVLPPPPPSLSPVARPTNLSLCTWISPFLLLPTPKFAFSTIALEAMVNSCYITVRRKLGADRSREKNCELRIANMNCEHGPFGAIKSPTAAKSSLPSKTFLDDDQACDQLRCETTLCFWNMFIIRSGNKENDHGGKLCGFIYFSLYLSHLDKQTDRQARTHTHAHKHLRAHTHPGHWPPDNKLLSGGQWINKPGRIGISHDIFVHDGIEFGL